MERENGRRAESLDRYWDAVLAGRSLTRPNEVDGVAAAIVAHLAGRQDAPTDQSARERTRQRVLAQAAAMEASMISQHHIHPAVMPGSPAVPPQPRRNRTRWAATQLATAALLVLTIVMGLVAFGTRRPSGPESPLSHLAAPSAQPSAASTPDASPQASSALAEFVAEIRLGSGSLSTPTGLAVGADGTLYAIDAIQDHIRLFSADGQPIGTWGETGEQLGQFRFHEGSGFGGDLTFGPDGNLYVLDTFNSRIQVLSPDNTVVRSWGEAGAGEGQFILPGGIAVDGAGRVYVADTENRRVQVFGAEGQFLEALVTPEDGGQRISPNDVAVDATGIVSVTDGTRKQVIRFDADGAMIGALGDDGSGPERMGDPSGVISDAGGNLFVADFAGNRIQVFAPDGTLLGTIGDVGVLPGQFISPVNMAFSPEGLLYVTEQGNRRIQVFRLRSLAETEHEIVSETLIDVEDLTLPPSHAQVFATITELQPGVSVDIDGLVGTTALRADQGTVRITQGDFERVLQAGEFWSAFITGDVTFENAGDDMMRIIEAGAMDATVSTTANPEGTFSDPMGGDETFVITDATTFAGGTGRLVLERLTLPPGAVLAPYAQPTFRWVGLDAGRVGVTLEGERLPFRWDPGEERTYGVSQSLPVIAPGTEVTLRNAEDRPMVLYRLTIEPDDSRGPPSATPAP